jgi:hypothetical protein
MMRRRRRAALSKLALSVLAALALPFWAGAAPREDITLGLRDKVITNLSSSGLVLSFQIAVSNRGSSARELVRYHYRVLVNRQVYLDLTVPLGDPISVPAGQEEMISLPVKITYALLAAAVGPLEDRALCDVTGEMFFADERGREEKTAFAFPGEFPVFKDPEIDFLPLRVNDLSVGGADVVFEPRFRNLNTYELIVDRIGFRLLFGDREVLAGLIPGDTSLPAGGEKTFSLPLVVDFFETGKAMRDLFDKSVLPCRFSGEIEISSAWGKLLVHFDKARDLPLEKAS